MSNMIVSSNRIKARFYNLEINGEIVETMLSSRMANILRDEYRAEGFAVDKVEVFTLTNGGKAVGDETVSVRDEANESKQFLTPAATQSKVDRDRSRMRAKNNRNRKNAESVSYHYTDYGRSKNSSLHQEYLMNLRKKGYRVHNRVTDEVWIGFQKEITERIYYYLNNLHGKMDDLDIKFLGGK